MTWVAAAIASSAVIGAYSANKAANAQVAAAKKGADAQERMFERQVELQEPWRKAGEEALNKLIPLSSEYTPFGMDQFKADPGYAFRLQEGLRALDRSAAARGGLLSGNQLRGVTELGQNLGSQEFMNAFNRYQVERQARLNPLQSLAGMGQTATNTLTGAAGQYGQNLAQNAATMGNLRASGYMNTANALSGALGQGLNYYQNQQMMNRFFPQTQPTQAVGGAGAFEGVPGMGG